MEAQGWPRTLRLEHAIETGETECEELTFPQPCAQHVRSVGGGTITFGSMMGVVKDWAGAHPNVVKNLSAKDVRTVMAWMNEALGGLQDANFDPETMPAPIAPLTLALKHPITVGSRTIDELQIRRVVAKHFYSLPAEGRPTLGHYLDVGALMVGETPGVIGKLSIEDAADLVRVVQGFFAAFQGT